MEVVISSGLTVLYHKRQSIISFPHAELPDDILNVNLCEEREKNTGHISNAVDVIWRKDN